MTKPLIIPNDLLMQEIAELLRSGSEVKLRAKGRSMHPIIKDGKDLMLIKPTKGVTLKVGDIVLAYTTHHKYVAHRIISIADDMATLMGDGNVRGTEQCRITDVLGRVTHIERGGRVIDCNSTMQKLKYHTLVPTIRILRIIKSKIIRP